jgi:cyclopropane fatty-acyl-phospholipid synthase-like methyltransferase
MFGLLKKIIKACLPYGIVILYSKSREFPGSRAYWEKRYADGGNSGAGSYNRFANFKAEIINNFVKNNNIQTVIEFGCGDGNQLSLARYPKYTGFDVSKTAVKLCKNRFKSDITKDFLLLNEYTNAYRAELVLSLDVIYHLVEDKIFEEHIYLLFQTSTRFVIIYAYDFDGKQENHERPRKFTKYIEEKVKGWNILEHIPNKYPSTRTDFYIYAKTEGA